MIQFILAHEALFAGLGVGVIDLLIAINPSWQANGLIHWVLLQLSALAPASK